MPGLFDDIPVQEKKGLFDDIPTVDPVDQAIQESFERTKTLEQYQSGGYAFLPKDDPRRSGYNQALQESIQKTNQFIENGGLQEAYRDLPFESVSSIKKKIQEGGAGTPDLQRLIALEHLRLSDPYKADLLEEMGTAEGLAVGFQTGLRHVGRGVVNAAASQSPAHDIGLTAAGLKPDPGNVEAERMASEYGPGSVKVGELAGEAAPFVPAAMATGGLPSLASRTVAMSGVGGLEGGLITSGQGGDAEDVAVGTLAGLTLGAGGELAIPYVSRAARKFWKSLKGKEPEAPLLTDDGRPTPSLQSELDKAGLSLDDMVKAYESPESVTTQIAKGARLSGEELGSRLDDIVAASSPSASKARAAESLGLDDIPPGVLTDNASFAQVSGALSAIPGSVSGEMLDNFTDQLAKKADDIIVEMGGELDKGAVSTQLREKILTARDNLYEIEDQIYQRVDDAVPKSDRLNSALGLSPQPGVTSTVKKLPVLAQFEKEIADVGGVQNLNKNTRKVYSLLKNNPTYGRIDTERKSIGSALSKKGGPYSDAEEGVLKKLYAQLTEVQGEFASKYPEAKSLWDQAKKITQQRKALEENSQLLFGRDLANGILPNLESGLKKLPSGDYKKFNQMMQAIPEEERAKVLATALNGIFTSPRSVNQSLTATQYTKWFDSLKRSPQAYKALKDNLPEGGMKRLEDLNTIAEGLADVSRNRVRTGIVKVLMDDFDKAEGWAAKLYDLADKSPVGVSQTVRVASNIAKMAAKEKEPIAQAADKLISSEAFRRAFIEAANDPDGAAAKKAEKVLKSSKAYKQYLQSQTEENRQAIASTGLIAWLLSDYEEESN